MKSKSELNMEIEKLEKELEAYKNLRESLLKQHIVNCDKLEKAQRILDDIPRPAQWLEEDCEDSSRDISENNFGEINEKMNRLREVFR